MFDLVGLIDLVSALNKRNGKVFLFVFFSPPLAPLRTKAKQCSLIFSKLGLQGADLSPPNVGG